MLDRQRISIGARVVLLLLCGGLTFIESLRSAAPAEELGRPTALLSASRSWRWSSPPPVEVGLGPGRRVGRGVPARHVGRRPTSPFCPTSWPRARRGLIAGIAGAVYVAGASSATVLAARLLGFTEQDPLEYSTTAAEWIVLALLTGPGCLGSQVGFARRTGTSPTRRPTGWSAS